MQRNVQAGKFDNLWRADQILDGMIELLLPMLQVKATVQNGDLMHAADMLCSISFDRDDEFFATAGVSRRIKVCQRLPQCSILCVSSSCSCEIRSRAMHAGPARLQPLLAIFRLSECL